MTPQRNEPVVLLVLDGWGVEPPGPGNAITRSEPARMARMASGSPCLLDASGRAVGVPDGVMGNSEVGHLTMGAGRVIEQDLVRIGDACRSGAIGRRPVMQELFRAAKAGSGRLHLLGLCSDAGVHAMLLHGKAIVRGAHEAGVPRIFVHPFTDGRDTPPTSGAGFVRDLEAFLATVPGASVGTLGGRYYGMDRDQRWDRIEKACRALVLGDAPRAGSAEAAVRASYERGVTDEFIEPVVIDEEGLLRDGDAVLFTNFRADRGRQLSRALTSPAFSEFVLPRPRLAMFATMTEYSRDLGLPAVFEPQEPRDTMGETFSRAGWPQLRVAETEKYAHVTYFFNGGREEPFPGEERILVPSPKVATYDLQPAMSAEEVTRRAVEWILEGGPRLVVMNLANPDMVGHTGDLEATIAACRVTDACVGRVEDAVLARGGVLFVTADHGNAEHMLDAAGGPHTAHTLAPVPLLVSDARGPQRLQARGGLADVAPTLLHAAGLPVPAVMTGHSLLLP